MNRPARLFLDANVLISAAWKDGSKVARIWQIENVELVTSDYVLDECWRNLPLAHQQNRLRHLLQSVRILQFTAQPELETSPLALPPKDQPVFAAAVIARANYLITGDRNHFGAWYGRTILGLRIEPPGSFPEILTTGQTRPEE